MLTCGKIIYAGSVLFVCLGATDVHGDGIPGSGIADFYYNLVTGTMILDSDGAIVVSMLIEGPQAESIDRFIGFDPETGTHWVQSFFDGKEQWIDVSVMGVQGVFKIATYEGGLSATDFLSVEYGTLGGDVKFSQVTGIPFASDFDRDTDVDGDDRVQWESDFGLNGNSDANNDGDSDGDDFLTWQREFGSGVGTVAASRAIPEPAAAVLLLLGCLTAHCARRLTRK